ncbi:histidine kinase [Pedobacter kyungheensis]|uniref:histidine kinase n=1 Tax=Pedobacter kyungheensis TaxID=1069985 RepID=A0A0C1D8A9_9SPHI|nr:HAMP domain-containing sensor histidine kinase [Pedobacter kyungheensis]KIA93566.1 histidine kinase [Pedobacter kyungheensis]
MKIKDRIALYFTLISTSMLLAVLCVIYFTFMRFLKADFFERLTDRTMVTAKLYLEADEISRDALSKVRHQYLQKLNSEVIRIYDGKDRATFIGDSAQYWAKQTIEKVRQLKRLQYTDGERQVVGIYYRDNQGNFVILASARDQGSQNRLAKLLKIMIVVFILISVILLLLSRWIAEKMLKPLNSFMQEVQQIGSGNMEARVATTDNKDEINLIAQSFNHLMEELEHAFILQKTFVANASHELRTPITRMMMRAELALSKERTTADYQQALAETVADSEKMDHIISGLLALAKMDLELINSQLSPIALDVLLDKISQDWQNQKQLSLSIQKKLVHQIQPVVLANAVLLQIALDNIIANAFKFSQEQQVKALLTGSDDTLQIYISDKGPGIPLAQQAEIFKPFYSRAKYMGLEGEGMGLYMAQKIIGLFKGSIEIDQQTDQGCTFILTLPRINPVLISI